MSFQITFNANSVAPNTAPEAVPSGIYFVMIVKSAEVAVRDGEGATFYELTMQILEGEHKGKFIKERLNCKNPNEQAREIAFSTLSAICHVTKVMQLGQSSDELHNKPFKVNVVKEPRNDRPDLYSNSIRGYFDMQGNPPGATAGGATTTAAAANASDFGASATKTETKAPPPPPAKAPAAPVAPAFPPEGWTAHPSAPGYFYKDQEVLSEADLRAKFSAPSAPAVPSAPAPATTQQDAGVEEIPEWAN